MLRHSHNRLVLAALLFLAASPAAVASLIAELDADGDRVVVHRGDPSTPTVTQHALPEQRPYLHPVLAPDGQGVLTQNRPDHHPHQTGIYWGLTRVDGRDYFHNLGGDHWRRVSVKVLHAGGPDARSVAWETVYELLDEQGQPLLVETQIWTLQLQDDVYLLDLQWTGQAKTNVTVGKHEYGGLFVRMPWSPGTPAEAVNAARQRNEQAEGRRAPWIDLGLEVEGREDAVHVAIFDHPSNPHYPQAWRVDGEYGIGTAPTRFADWQLPAGETAMIRHRLVVYTGPLDDVRLTRRWSEYTGQDYTWVLWNIAQQEGRQAELLQPEEAAAAMELPEGFTVNVWAAEPQITQPMAFCWDDRGRLWVAENRDYESRGDGFARAGNSRILILEDTDRDGTADRRKVFLEGVPFPAAIAVGHGGLWLGAPPNLLFVPDRDNDDRADTDAIEVRLTGWGIDDRHETINSLHWGPDGWLYGCQGFATYSRVGKPADPHFEFPGTREFPDSFEYEGPTEEIDGGVWRYHPLKERFEVVAHGFSNPWGLDYDAGGQLFITACVIPHLWHVVPGGIYHRQGGRHFNPYVYNDIKTIADHRHRSAHGGARVYQSDAFPEPYQGRIFMANIHEHAVLTDILEPSGSGFIGRHCDDFLLANNAQWIGFGIEIGPEGGVYVLDWHDADICGKDVLHPDTGRIYRIVPKQSQARNWPARYGDLSQLPDDDLVALQESPSDWHARRARLILHHRAATGLLDPATGSNLLRIFQESDNIAHRLRAMWALHQVGAWSDQQLIALLDDSAPLVRAWAIQLLLEDRSPTPELLARLIGLAQQDDSPVVQLYLASALQRVEREDRWPIARGIVQHAEYAGDHNIPKMVWFGIEPGVADEPEAALQLARQSQMPLVARHIGRRLVDGGKLELLVESLGRDPRGAVALLEGARDALAGRPDAEAPRGWPAVYEKLLQQPAPVADLARALAARFGDVEIVAEQLRLLEDADAEPEARAEAMAALARRKRPELPPLLLRLLDSDWLRQPAIRAAVNYDDDRLAKKLLRDYPRWSDAEKLDAIHTLAARQTTGRMLTDAIAEGQIPRRDIPAYAARLLRRVVGPRFVDVWGPVDQLPEAQQQDINRLRRLLTSDRLAEADPQQGRVVFGRTCQTCHRLGDEGGQIGPDLTGANRRNLEYLLGNIVTPSAVIQDAYRMHLVQTDEGRIYSGVLAGETAEHLQLRVADRQEPVAIPKRIIESREIAEVSMMPEGLLRNLTDDEILNLFAYLIRE